MKRACREREETRAKKTYSKESFSKPGSIKEEGEGEKRLPPRGSKELGGNRYAFILLHLFVYDECTNHTPQHTHTHIPIEHHLELLEELELKHL